MASAYNASHASGTAQDIGELSAAFTSLTHDENSCDLTSLFSKDGGHSDLADLTAATFAARQEFLRDNSAESGARYQALQHKVYPLIKVDRWNSYLDSTNFEIPSKLSRIWMLLASMACINGMPRLLSESLLSIGRGSLVSSPLMQRIFAAIPLRHRSRRGDSCMRSLHTIRRST